MPPSPRNDPYAGFNIRVEIDGVAVAAFMECSGLASETTVIEYRQAGDAGVRKLPGITKYSPITLKRGLTTDRSLWEWRKAIVNGTVDRRDGHVVLLDAAQNEVARWSFHDAWPSKWIGPVLNAQSNEVAIETLELVHEGLDWEN